MILAILLLLGLAVTIAVTLFCISFDQAVLTRRKTIFHVPVKRKVVALTFDDGPSPEWTPLVLSELKKADIKATFFMTGRHVDQYPDIAKQVAREGHEIENHGYAHNVVIYYREEELEEEIKYTEYLIKNVTGKTTKYFRPPKAWLGPKSKKKIKQMGYEAVLWSVNSKDWVGFNLKKKVKVLSAKTKKGDILLFHDGGGVFKDEGGDRSKTAAVIPLLVKELRKKGFDFVTVDELVKEAKHV